MCAVRAFYKNFHSSIARHLNAEVEKVLEFVYCTIRETVMRLVMMKTLVVYTYNYINVVVD